jgi:hypothetical protein
MKTIPQLPILVLAPLLCLRPASLRGDPLDQWTWRNPLPQGNSLSAVACGNNQFVAVGYLGTILTSPDGITWTERTSASAEILGIAFGNNQFVAVGYETAWNPDIGRWQVCGAILTSFDGINWTNRALATNDALYGITYANNQFVAVGARCNYQMEPDHGAILTSPDAITWTSRDAGTTNLLSGIVYGGNLFVAVGGGGTIVTSPDGISWTSRDSRTTNFLSSIAYGNNQFVAVRNGGIGVFFGDALTDVLTSADGISWTRQEGWWGGRAVAFGKDLFVAVGGHEYGGLDNGTILSSSNGITWTWIEYAGTFDWLEGVVYDMSRFVAVGDAGDILTSADGLTWTNRTARVTDNIRGLLYANNQFMGVGDAIVTSPNGITWTNIPVPLRTNTAKSWYSGIAYEKNQFVVVGGAHDAQDSSRFYDTILTSSDGLTWIDCHSGGTNPLSSVAYGNNQFVAVGDLGTILSSPNGITWTSRTSGTTNWLSSIAYGNNQFVAVGGGSPVTILTSPDGVIWTRRVAGTGMEGLAGVVYGSNTFVAVGSSYMVLTSPDGISWTNRSSGTGAQLNAVAYGNNTFVAVGYDTIVSSHDGLSWTSHASANGYPLTAVAYGNKTFVVGGYDGEILQSGVMAPMPLALGPVMILPHGEVQVALKGPDGQTYSIQASTDLSQWIDLTNVVLAHSSAQFVDQSATNHPQRFYRAVSP